MSVRVYKVGGPALEDAGLVEPLARDVRAGEGPALLVHGGGRQVDRLLEALGIATHRVEGRRVTSREAMDVVEMVLSGSMNKRLAAGLTAAGLPSVGISGRDGGLVRASLVPELGRVGTVERVETAVLQALWNAGLVPVVSPVCLGPDGGPVNVNADEAALGLARGLGARSLVYLSDVDGVTVDGRPVASLDAGEAERLIAADVIRAGMAMKVRAALDAAALGLDVVIAGRARLLGHFPGTKIAARRTEASKA